VIACPQHEAEILHRQIAAASEFNAIGSSQANLNAGPKLTVRIDLADGTPATPVCQANDGTAGETNNLNSARARRRPA
jgi:hypothetical protein